MRPFLAMARKQKERGIVFLGEELETRRIFKGMYWVLLGEFDSIGTFERVEIRAEVVEKGG